MHRKEHRYDTAELEPARHRAPQKRRVKRGLFRQHFLPRWVYRIILILLICVLAMLGWFNRRNLTPSNVLAWVQDRVIGMGVGDGYPYEFSGSSVAKTNFISMDKNLYTVSNTSLILLNSTAKELINRPHSFGNPVLKTAGVRAMLYNLGGKGCRIEGTGSTLTQFTTKSNILAGAIAPDGRYALLTETDGYCGLLTVYTSDNRVQSYYWFADYYPTAVALSPDGHRAAVTGVSAKNGGLVSALYILEPNSGKTQAPAAEFEDNMLFSVYWDDSGAVTAIGDRAVECMNANNRAKNEYSYNGMKLTACCFDSGRTALGLSPYTGSENSRLVVLNQTGAQTLSMSVGKEIGSVSLYGQSLAALLGNNACFYSMTGAAAGVPVAAGGDARALVLRDESSAYILGVSEIRLVNSR